MGMTGPLVPAAPLLVDPPAAAALATRPCYTGSELVVGCTAWTQGMRVCCESAAAFCGTAPPSCQALHAPPTIA